MFKNLFKKKEPKNVEKDMVILTSKFCIHPIRFEGEKIIQPFKFVASVDLKTNEVSEKDGYIFYEFEKTPELENQLNATTAQFQDYVLYHVKCKEAQITSLRNAYLVTEICESGSMVMCPELEKIRNEYVNPPKIEDEVGCFVWDREFEKYEGEVDWPEAPCRVALQSKGSSELTLALQALQKFKRIYNSRVDCDENLRKYAGQKLKEQMLGDLADSMTLDSISVFWDGQFDFYFDCKDSMMVHISYFEESGQYGAQIYEMDYNVINLPPMQFEQL